ncbi:leucine-rich repeat protein [Strigomonas culicis]|uniref:Leucine-rich repeat protein n=1 Tax=Strigomonas culicis TaxID=28005 RepID=S9UR72_9TRYP|nr:leucine-rich repeat protein [Strigomonas culicis]EPY33432.1 leucine-rich repeat protein [Strigomonas culicis]|eukprot:EPY31035.1 leucine-rich repeat protein [Strigomonas culicis]
MAEVELKYGELNSEALAEALANPAEVTALDLSGNNISPSYCIELVDAYVSKLVNLESLDLKDNKIGPSGAVHLFEALLRHCPKLTYLDVNENAIQDEALYTLALLVQSSKLSTLYVVTNHITPRGLPTLCDGIVASATLTDLSLAFNLLGDEGARMVAELLGSHPTLVTLDISDNRISDEGAVAIAAAFIVSNASRLETLNLSVNQIGDVGFQAIAEALTRAGNAHLTHLDLGCNDTVRDAGRAALARHARHIKYVQFIDLTSCDLSDEDVRQLIAAVESHTSSLTGIEWFNNPRMSLEVEKQLFTVIEEKTARVAARSDRDAASRLIVAAGVGMALLAVVVAAVVKRRC